MAINLSDNILAQTTKPGDAKYGPYSGSGTTAALALADAKTNGNGSGVFDILIVNFRYKGLTVGIILTVNGAIQPIVEYWFESGTANGNLVEKSSGTVGTVTSVGLDSDSGAGLGITSSGIFKFAGGANVTTSIAPSTNIVTINSSDEYEGTVKGTGTVNSIPYWSAVDTLSDSAASFFNTKTVTIKSNLELLGEGGGAPTAASNLKFYDKSNTNYVSINGPEPALDTDSYDLLLPNILPNVVNQILESNNVGDLSWIATPTSGTGTVTGTGTQNKLTKWSTTGGAGIENSEVTDNGSSIILGEDSTNGETMVLNTINRNVRMNAYGQGIFTGSPIAAGTTFNLRRSAAFGNDGKVVDNYIYDTFQITLAALAGLGSTPATGFELIDPGANHSVLLADMWFYRQVNNSSNPGSFNNNTDIVIGPENLTNIPTDNPDPYFRITSEFLNSTSTAINGDPPEPFKGSALYQGNLNANDPNAGQNNRPKGAWQVGTSANQAPLGNKVYITLNSLTASPVAPTFPSIGTNETKYFIGLKYRLLNFTQGVVNNTNLITIDVSATASRYNKCSFATGGTCEEMPAFIGLPAGTAAFVIVQNDISGNVCCYFNAEEATTLTPDMVVIGTYDECSVRGLEETVCKADATEKCDVYQKCEKATGKPCEQMDEQIFIPENPRALNTAYIETLSEPTFGCCYSKVDVQVKVPTSNVRINPGIGFETCDELPDECVS